MSAFVVDNEHINAIVNYAFRKMARQGAPFNEPETLGQMLLNENSRSVNHRYNEDDVPPEDAPLPDLDLIAHGALGNVRDALNKLEVELLAA